MIRHANFWQIVKCRYEYLYMCVFMCGALWYFDIAVLLWNLLALIAGYSYLWISHPFEAMWSHLSPLLHKPTDAACVKGTNKHNYEILWYDAFAIKQNITSRSCLLIYLQPDWSQSTIFISSIFIYTLSEYKIILIIGVRTSFHNCSVECTASDRLINIL